MSAVLEQSGVRAVFGKALMDSGTGVPDGLRDTANAAIAEVESLAKRWHGAAGGRLRVSLAPRFVLSCSEPLWRDVAAMSKTLGLLVHTHLSESPAEGREVEAAVRHTATRYFAAHGVLSERFVGAHGVWLEPDDLAQLKNANAALVHCPGSNLKLGSGLARVRAWRDLGIRCGIGSDGAACDNRLDTFHELSLAAGVSRVVDPAAHLSARDTLALATCDGARALGWYEAIGSLEPGKQADVIAVNHDAAHHAPNAEADPYVALVHSARAQDVRLTAVAGRVLARDGAATTLDGARVTADARMEAKGLKRRANLA
jgi:5-methylthioadenosine/S-adenosylhomocysteine deaminase